ncbi:MAG TPA: PSD1 and planctomycete cytochrome C domain-containing protein [Opitutaceae bacterium]|nr:PSD1 and planctomycete cytochrome C domain-containing protein [Opitutaceae bacterium]
MPFGMGVLSLLALFSSSLAAAEPAQISPSDLQFFESKIRPILVENCYKCHSREADKVKGGLLLDTREGLLAGGSSGSTIVPGKPDESVLIQAIRYTDPDLQMPPKGEKLSDRQIADLTEWVKRGAPDPRMLAAKGSSNATYGGVGRQHWSFQPVKKPAIPAVKNSAWPKTPVDNFILAKLEENALQPNAPADKRALLRRVTFDLTGLPPTETEMQAFLADNSPAAFTRVVDRLLASPHYGERWGRHWLDVARYSDSKGDAPNRAFPFYPHAWTYRDYVIDAFNTDKPFNQFIVEQLAADRLVEAQSKKITAKNPDAIIDQSSLAAMGFLTLGNQFDGNVHDVINDRIDVTTKAFLGLTVSCARCHDHKFDPIPTKDYYSLYGVFANSVEPKQLVQAPTLQSRIAKTPELVDYLAKATELQKQHADVEEQFAEMRRSRVRDADKRRELVRAQQRVNREIGELEMNHPGAPARANVLTDVPRSRDYPVLVRGEAQNKGDIVPRRFLEILAADPKKRAEWHEGSGRLQLAQAIADPKNPLTARVFVNRVWQQHFGEGFVATPDDLGNMSSPPTHPELLDWLASEFVEGGWSVKRLHRFILLSSTYQLSGAANPDPRYAETDPTNKLFWRANLRRLEFEAMYDSILAISGALDPKLGGKPVTPTMDSFGKRRALYTYINRQNPPELLTQFDFPNPDVPTGKRYMTLVPQQALFLMNSPLVIETARKLTHLPEFAKLPGDRERVASLYLAIFQRPPSEKEVELGLEYVRTNPKGTGLDVEIPALKNAREQRKAERQAAQAKQNAKGRNDQRPIGSSIEYGGPVDAWTKLAHALFQANEAMFVN